MSAIRRASAAGLLFVPAVVWAADDREVSLSSLIARISGHAVVLEAAGPGAADLLAAAAEVESLPAPCATPLILLLTLPETPLPPALLTFGGRVAAPPALEAERLSLTRDGRFAIHYSGAAPTAGLLSVDRDRNGLPDLVDRVAEALAASRSSLVARLGYPPPAADGDRLDVILADIGRGLEGYAVPRAGGASPFVVLDAGLAADRVMPATLHQVAHLSLLSFQARAPGWWAEASASFLTLLTTGDLRAHEAALHARLQAPGRTLAADGLLLMEGGLLWPLYLSESAGDPSVVRQIWEETARGLDALAATDAVLRRAGRSLADASREFAVWNLFTGERDDGQHYAFGRSLPTALLAEPGPDLPLRYEQADPVEPLGSAALRLPGDGGRGTVVVEVAGEGGHVAADLLVFYRPWGPQPVLVPVVFDAAGTARLPLPWADALEAWIVLRNDGLPGAGVARFVVRAAFDPYAPYDLASFTASESGASILLEWTTAAEDGLLAWNVYRSETPRGPFTRLNAVAVPAMGDSATDTGYIFVDDYARPGRRYYYLLEGLTDLGLPQRSHVVSGRIATAR